MSNESIVRRPRYWKRLEPWVRKPVIKVLTGQRRVGKSCVLLEARQRLRESAPEIPVLFIEKESADWRHLADASDLLAWVAAAVPTGPAVLMIDEVQEIAGFDTALRSLFVDGRFDLYVTGSNAELLSGEIASRFAGRSVSVEIHPLSYDEFLTFADLEDSDAALLRYLRYGGLPFLRHLEPRDDIVFEYLGGVARTALLKDIVARHNVRNVDLLERLVLFLADSVCSPVSANSIVRFLKAQRVQLSVPTVLDYLERITQAYLVRRVRRTDLVGKRILEVAEKYYFEDLGIRAALRGTRPEDASKLVENAVFGRLLVDGFQVTTGELRGREIDFVCERSLERHYVQATYLMPDAATREREFRVLHELKDNHPKVVVSFDPITADEDGVRHLGLRRFLRDGL